MLLSLKESLRRLKYAVLHLEYDPPRMYFDKEKKVAFVEVAKNGCSSIKNAVFQDYSDKFKDPMEVHYKLTKHETRDMRTAQGCFTFSVVREPAERVYSCYTDKVERRFQETGTNHFYTPFYRIVALVSRVKLKKKMDFLEFLQFIEIIPDRIADRHFKSQVGNLSINKVNYNRLFLLDTLKEDWKKLEREFGYAPLTITNKSGKSSGHLFTNDELTIIRRRYNSDYKLYTSLMEGINLDYLSDSELQ